MKKPELDHEALAKALEEHNRTAVGYLTDELSQDQDDNLARYLGQPYGDEEEGSSNAISHDVAEVVDWALPDLLEPFISGERVVELEPAKPGDEEWCEQASVYLDHVFMVDNPGVTILHDVAKTALIQKVGFCKTRWKEDDHVERCTQQGLSAINLGELQGDPSITIEDATPEPVSPELLAIVGEAFPDGQSYSVTYSRRERRGRVEVLVCPPEQIKVAARATTLDRIAYICHEVPVSRAQLISDGFDADEVMGLVADKASNAERSDTRFVGESTRSNTSTTKLAEEVLLHEEYIRGDFDEDGTIETVLAFRVGKTILSAETVDGHCFTMWTPDRIPSRLIGLGLADKVKQTQRIKTAIVRQMLDNVYLANNPRIEVPEQAVGENTIGDLLSYRIGGLIRTQQPGMLRAIELPDRSAIAMQALTYMDSVREQQSGVVRNGMAVSSDEIDPKSATEARSNDRNEQVRKRLMARMFAETFMVPLFRRMLHLIVKYQDFERTIRQRGKWVNIDPRAWNADLTAKIGVGLGHANRAETLQAGQLVLTLQMQAMQIGLATPEHLYKTASKIVEASGLQFASDYFVDPTTPEGKQLLQQHQQSQQAQGQDPRVAEIQGKLQLKQQEMQMDAQASMAQAQRDIQIEMLKIEAKQAIEQHKTEFDLRARMAQIQGEYDIAMRELGAEMQLKRTQMAMEMQLQARAQDMKAATEASAAKASVGNVRFGGKVG